MTSQLTRRKSLAFGAAAGVVSWRALPAQAEGAPSRPGVLAPGPDRPAFEAMDCSTRSNIEGLRVPVGVRCLRTAGFATVGDGGGGFYRRARAEPSHQGKVRSLEGAWWEYLPEGQVKIAAIGGVTGTVENQLEVIRSAFELAEQHGVPVLPQDGVYRVTTNGEEDKISLRSVPTTLRPLQLQWTIAGGGSNRLFDINSIHGLAAIEARAGSPAIAPRERTLRVSPGLPLAPGDWVAIKAGADPSDGNQPHWAQVARVESYSGTALSLADGAPLEVHYDGAATVDTRTGFLLYKLEHNPTGGDFRYAVDYSKMGSSQPTSAVKLRYCRGWRVSGEEYEPSYGLTIADGATDGVVESYYAVQTARQVAEGRATRQLLGPYSCRNVTHKRVHLVSTAGTPPTSGLVHLEAGARNIRIDELVIDVVLSADDLRFWMFALQGGASVTIGNLHLHATHQIRDRSISNTVGGESIVIENLHIHQAGPQIDLRDVRGRIIDYRGGYRFGPLEEFEVTLWHTGSGGEEALPLRNLLVAEAALWSSQLTKASDARIRCDDDLSVRVVLDRTADGSWVRTPLPDPAVYWSAEKGVAKVNRLDLTAKTAVVTTDTPAEFLFKITGRRVDGDLF